ncbi:molecular chaperone HtpG, partial [Streptomyces sp. NPDC101166]
QQDRQIQMIRKRLVKKVLSTVKDLKNAEDQAKYQEFWREFGRVLKEGLLSDADNRETILGVSSFASTHSESELTTLAGYVERMPETQSAIYYMTGESRQQIENSPHMEALRAKGLEVLVLTDPVDEMWVGSVTEFEGKSIVSIAKGEVDLETEDEKKASEQLREQQEKDFSGVLGWLQQTLDAEVKEVRLTNRLTTSPACIVGDVFDFTPMLERMYRASGQELPHSKRILELNPDHALVTGLRDAYAQVSGDEDKPLALTETAELLYGTAVLAEGGELKDPAHFARILADRLTRTL